MLTGELPPDSGTVRLGANLDDRQLDQRRAALDPQATLADALTGGGSDYVEVGGAKKHVIGYMRDFLFQPEQARKPGRRIVRRRARAADAGAGAGACPRTCSSSTSRPTISISRRWNFWRKCSPIIPAR